MYDNANKMIFELVVFYFIHNDMFNINLECMTNYSNKTYFQVL